jgi:alkanesulfonate monooxygenase
MLNVYTTMPEWDGTAPAEYRQHVIEQARWTEEAGCRGALIFSDNEQLEPWALAQLIVANTSVFVPLVAVNPVYMHPFNVAQMVSTISALYERTVDLNLVAGGFEVHLTKLGCRLDHGQRYDQLTEYGQIVLSLLAGGHSTSHRGTYYRVSAASLVKPLDPGLTPRTYVSGASADCIAAQQALSVERLTYPRELGTYPAATPLAGCGIRIGIIAREDSAAAWDVARRRFPVDPVGEQSHDWASGMVKSQWHKQQSRDAQAGAASGAYWLYPFRAYRTFAPYLVGSYAEVGATLARYRALGAGTVILDHFPDAAELRHALVAVRQSSPAGLGR